MVIELANSLISKNLNRSAGKMPLKAVKKGNHENVVRIYKFKSIEEEAKWISTDIAQRAPQDIEKCAVLARTKKLLDFAGHELANAGVPVYFAARKDEFKSAPLRMLHSVLRLANSQKNKQSVATLCKSFYELEGILAEQSQVISRASADGLDFLHAWLEEVKQRQLEKRTQTLLSTGIKPLLTSLNYRGLRVMEVLQNDVSSFKNALFSIFIFYMLLSFAMQANRKLDRKFKIGYSKLNVGFYFNRV